MTTIRIQTLKHTVVDSETASRAALGRLKAAENEKLIAERNEQISIRKKEGLKKQIEKLTKELGTLNV
ncbi:MAG: hypothetical protein EXS64_12705 [Candidatus Latescibacteria bacterium]|nr:hypothetical protein [Candidatus Latescibacterota bacterium]